MKDTFALKVTGHVIIKDVDTNEVLVDKMNMIHPENMSLAIAQSVGNKDEGPVKDMVFGNGGSTVNGIGAVTYLTPNTIGATATLYNQTYSKIVDDNNINNLSPSNNKMEISHVTGNLFSDLVVTCTLDNGEPSGQDAFDNTNNVEDTYVFDELGLVNYDGKLLTHLVFSPVQKSLSRKIQVIYTVRFQLL